MSPVRSKLYPQRAKLCPQRGLVAECVIELEAPWPGPVRIEVERTGVTRVELLKRGARIAPARERGRKAVDTEFQQLLERAERSLRAYFSGALRRFDLPLALGAAGSPFDRRVWEALLEIPFGCTATYGEIARRIGAPRAARAVGGAAGRNPLPVLVPCHRLVGAGGRLGGFSGGLEWKRALLALESEPPALPRARGGLGGGRQAVSGDPRAWSWTPA